MPKESSRMQRWLAGVVILLACCLGVAFAEDHDGGGDVGAGAGDRQGSRMGGANRSREAYVTLVSTPEYVIGAEVLGRMIKQTGSERRMLVRGAQSLGQQQQPPSQTSASRVRRWESPYFAAAFCVFMG
jgi:hypothetical protein